MEKRKRQRLALAGILCLLGMLFAGCIKEERAKEEEREELVLWSYYETERQQDSMDQLVEGFNSSQDEYHLTWEYQGPMTEFKKNMDK